MNFVSAQLPHSHGHARPGRHRDEVRVDWSSFGEDLETPSAEELSEDRDLFLHLLKRYFDATQLSADWEALSQADDETLVNAISMLCPFEPQEKQALLEAPTLAERKRDLRALMEFVVASPEGDGDIQ
ncbi:MAG: hypothetical protein AAFR28_04670 [Pseudomonadota bacterium]